MPVAIQKLDDEPIVLLIFTDPYDPEGDVETAHLATQKILENGVEKLYRLVDISAVDMSFSKLVLTLANTARRGGEGSIRDTHIDTTMVIGNKNTEFMAESLQQEQYMGHKIPYFKTQSEALQHMRDKITADRTTA